MVVSCQHLILQADALEFFYASFCLPTSLPNGDWGRAQNALFHFGTRYCRNSI